MELVLPGGGQFDLGRMHRFRPDVIRRGFGDCKEDLLEFAVLIIGYTDDIVETFVKIERAVQIVNVFDLVK